MLTRWTWSDLIWDYVALQIGHLRANLPFLRPIRTKLPFFRGLISQSEQISIFWRPDGPSKQNLTSSVQACCDPNILGEIFEILSIHNTQIFENFHLALPPIIRGPGEWDCHTC